MSDGLTRCDVPASMALGAQKNAGLLYHSAEFYHTNQWGTV